MEEVPAILETLEQKQVREVEEGKGEILHKANSAIFCAQYRLA